MVTKIQNGESKLRPRARIIKTIGNELISNDIVAIIELVKNSYDADASKVKIIFEGPLNQGEGRIIIEDNGIGMNLKTITNAWMEPATNFKLIKRKSKKGRKILGEKGIGRFASAKLAKQLEMITKIKDDNEIYVIFNWEDFEDNKKYLDEIDCVWHVRKPELIKTKGTLLKLNNLESDWDHEKLRQLKVALSRLMNPVSPVKGFEIEFVLPPENVYNDLRGKIEPPETLGKPDYSIKGSMEDSGKVTADYYSKKKNKKETINENILVKQNLKSKKQDTIKRNPSCGPFSFEFRVWNREPEAIKELAKDVKSTIRDIKRDLNDAGGIGVYRDDFRVLPYGEPKNDWLRLDFRRVQNPTRNLSNNQIIGYVMVSLDNNIELKDQSNREGIVDSTALSDLKKCIITLLSFLEVKRYKERRPEEKKSEAGESLFSKFDLTSIKEIISKKLPQDEEAKKIIKETDDKIKEGVKKVQEVLSRYRRLSTLGQLLDVVIHDGNNILYSIDSETKLLEKGIKKKKYDKDHLLKHIEVIKRENFSLALLFKRLEPFGGRRRGRPKDTILEEAISDIFQLHNSLIEKLKVKIELPKSKNTVRLDPSEFEIIIVNLLQNSLYWLETVDEKDREIVVSLDKDDDKLTLIFSDSGPGIKNDDIPYIFNPYFSTKPDGVGLGLTIVGELVSEYEGTFELIENGPLDGASFRLTFTKRI